MSENDGLGGIIGIRGLGGEKLAAASYALRHNFKKKCFVPTERNQEFLSSVFYKPAAKYVSVDAWPTHSTYHRPKCENCDTSVGRSEFVT